MSGREVCALPTAYGFSQVRQRGSHIIVQRQTDDSTVTVPVPDHDELRRGTLSSIIRQSGLPRALLEG